MDPYYIHTIVSLASPERASGMNAVKNNLM